MEVRNEIAVLSEEDITAVINAVQERLDSITLEDIEIYKYEESGTYTMEDDELDLCKINDGLWCYIDWHCDWWYKEWTEVWHDPYCTPSFSEGDIDWMWLDKVSLCHNEYDEIENQDEIENRIKSAIYSKQKEAWDKYIERKKAIRAKKQAQRLANQNR